MPVHSAAVGQATAPRVVDVTPRRTMAYAAGVPDTNARYFDDAADRPLVAPPAFCAALEWPATLALRDITALGVADDEALRAVHASQDSTFHRLIAPGHRLRTTSTIVQVKTIAPGAFLLAKHETVNDTTGDPVVTTYMGSIYRGVTVEGEDRTLEEAPALVEPESEPVWSGSVVLPIAPEAAHVYTECADIWNPIHTERRVALAAGLPGPILHGTALWALAARELVNRCCDGDPRRLRRLAGRFTAMVQPDSTVALEYDLLPGEPQLARFTVRNAAGDDAISAGLAVIGA